MLHSAILALVAAVGLIGPLNNLRTIEEDMTLPHEGRLSGLPLSVDWSTKPRIGMGLNPGVFRAFIPWGQLYLQQGATMPANTRVQIRNLRAYLLSKRSGEWISVSSGEIEGAAYREDFAGDVNKPADVRPEPTGGVSVRLEPGFNYHFWAKSGRVPIDPEDLAGVFVTVQARLIPADARRPDDRAKARVLLGAGADYWQAVDSKWDQWKTNGDVAIGRMKRVTNAWRAFNIAVPLDAVRRNPPPLE
ncbi:MAG: hypothetical protein WHU10_11490 [Fimbriimonadales bacterium]